MVSKQLCQSESTVSLAVTPLFVVVVDCYAKLSSKLLPFLRTKELKFYHTPTLSPVLGRTSIGKCMGVFEPANEQKVCLAFQGWA